MAKKRDSDGGANSCPRDVLEGELRRVRDILDTGGDWYPANTFKLEADFARLSLVTPEERLFALRLAAREVSYDVFDPPPPPATSDEPVCRGTPMRAFSWASPGFVNDMYFKFGFTPRDGYLYIFSLHPADFRF